MYMYNRHIHVHMCTCTYTNTYTLELSTSSDHGLEQREIKFNNKHEQDISESKVEILGRA
jgi:hypothetical protein